MEADISGNVEAISCYFSLLYKFPLLSISYFKQKLRNFIKQHEGKLTTVNEIVVLAISEKDETAIDALLWLKRYLLKARLYHNISYGALQCS